MATYTEIRSLFGHGDLRNKMDVAVIVAAEGIRVEDPATSNHANRLLWSKAAFANPRAHSDQMLMALLAANKDLTVAQIEGASDTALQTRVDEAVDVFADGS